MPIKPTPEGGYEISVCVKRRRLHRRLPPGSSSHDAKLLEAELIKALATQAKVKRPVVPGDPLLTELLADYTERHALQLRSTDTAQYHAYRIGAWCEGRRASETRQVVATILEDLLPVYKPATVNRSLGALKKALRAGWERGAIDVDYSGLVKRVPENNQKTLVLTIEEVSRLADAASEPVRAAIWMGLLTGCRRGEICKLQPEDIGPTTLRIQAGNTKTLRYREVPIIPALRPWLAHVPLPVTFEGVKSGIRRARVKAELPGVGFHTLRHSCATILLSLGEQLHVIRDILGHTSIKTTERYAHAMVAPQRRALEALGAAVNYTKGVHQASNSEAAPEEERPVSC
ncbi:XerC Integrase [uncultured Caudovirales phage]|uniref:Integrase n=1 Tax=uncultured Caudovirales phage TaxID=2100421 RepID=A0A6J5NN70_9CAUD|nr:XerC Integrase [uncultured Caudovirales phage]